MAPTASEGLVWINGTVSPLDGATVALEDRGFVFGDGVYEVVRTYGGRPFAMAAHMNRFTRSAAGIELQLPLPMEAIANIALDLHQRTRFPETLLYFQLTRGAAPRYHPFPENTPPTLVIWAQPLREVPDALREAGVKAITHPDERWARCDLKTICLLPNVLAKEHAKRQDAYEAILLRDGLVTEGSSSNMILVKGGRLVTAMADHRILPGITRDVVLKLAREAGLPVEERDVSAMELATADEVLMLATTAEVMPIVQIDDRPVGDGRPGPIGRQLLAALRAVATPL
jgi:D-alanine transaminase